MQPAKERSEGGGVDVSKPRSGYPGGPVLLYSPVRRPRLWTMGKTRPHNTARKSNGNTNTATWAVCPQLRLVGWGLPPCSLLPLGADQWSVRPDYSYGTFGSNR